MKVKTEASLNIFGFYRFFNEFGMFSSGKDFISNQVDFYKFAETL
jgi:hypothetical protein